MRTTLATLSAILLGGGLALAQSSSSDMGYRVEEPSEDAARPESDLYNVKTKGDDVKAVVDHFSRAPGQFTQTGGKALYDTTCRACHMADGKGAEGAGHYPPLAGNPKLVSKYYIVAVLLNGYHGMPRFGDQMDDDQIADVVNYVRGGFGNPYPSDVTEEDVAGMRPLEGE